MFLALVRERPRPARTSKNLLAGGAGRVHPDTQFTPRLEIPMAVSEARKRFSRTAIGVADVCRTAELLRIFNIYLGAVDTGECPAGNWRVALHASDD